jgi:hypothetical protein
MTVSVGAVLSKQWEYTKPSKCTCDSEISTTDWYQLACMHMFIQNMYKIIIRALFIIEKTCKPKWQPKTKLKKNKLCNKILYRNKSTKYYFNKNVMN